MRYATILLTTIAVLIHPGSGNPDSCERVSSDEERRTYERFYFYLRQNAATGRSFKGTEFPRAQLMYVMKEDGDLKEEASNLVENLSAPLRSDSEVHFRGEYPGSLERMLETILKDPTQFPKLVYPYAAQYGCSYKLENKNGTCAATLYCVLAHLNTRFVPGPCVKDSDCPYQPASCKLNLCYSKGK
ncbi:hypothetical protein RB195_002569 [Necator americanus]|uniref:Uncharacterized protein n=1 Tax=Necator americanus TaxID=51031 RepID=A0ABR1DJM6_NECAM